MRDGGQSEVGPDAASTPYLLRKCIIFALQVRKNRVKLLKHMTENFFHTSGQIAGLRRTAFPRKVQGSSPSRRKGVPA
jgi:hypothetical protein